MENLHSQLARHLVVMVKVPVAGRVKTRLARQLGDVQAAKFYRSTTAAVLSRVAAPGRWQTHLAVTPDIGVASSAWPLNVHRFGQGGGDLGQRMQRVFDGMPPGPVVIIGSDIPGIRADHIALAFRALGRCDAVFGPAPDGGYWLIGLKRQPRVLTAFDGVRWSCAHTMKDTLENLAGHKVAFLQELDDVDQADDLERLSYLAGRVVLPEAR